MTSLPRESKFRHIFNEISPIDQCFTDLKPDCFGESQHITVNGTYWAVPITAGGGGSFMVHEINKPGRVARNHPLFKVHTSRVLELAFNNFHENIISTSSDDCTVSISTIPEGMDKDVTEASKVLSGHSKKVTSLAWHPTTDNVLASSGNDRSIILWDVEEGVDAVNCTDHDDLVYSINWNANGQYIASSCQDRIIRVMDPRQEKSVIMSVEGHDNKKHSKVFWLNHRNMVGSSGFTKDSFRELLFFDLRKISEPFHKKKLDRQNSKFLPTFVEENDLLYLAGKGDTGMRIYEITDQEGFCHPITELKALEPQKGVAVLPRRYLNTQKGEIFKTYRLKPNSIEPVSVLVPRRNSAMVFQEDLYPDCYAGTPSLSIDDYFEDKNADPNTVSMNKKETAGASGGRGRRRGRAANAEEKSKPAEEEVKEPAAEAAVKETPKPRNQKSRHAARASTRKSTHEPPQRKQSDSSELEKIKKELQTLKESLNSKDEEIKSLQKSLEKQEDKNEKLEEKLQDKTKNCEDLEAKLKESGGNGDNDEEIEDLKRKIKIQRKKKRAIQKELDDSEDIINKQAQDIKALNHKIIELGSQ